MLKAKEILIFIIGLMIGLTFAKVFLKNKNPSPASLEETQENLALCEEKISQTSEKLKTLDQLDKAQSSDEILAEMMKIFIADWGLKLQFANIKKENPAVPMDAKCEFPKVALQPEPSPAVASAISTSDVSVATAQDKSRKIQTGLEINLIGADSEENAQRLAERLKVDDLFTQFAETKEAEIKNIENVEGKFVGEVRPKDNKKKPTDIELELEIRKRKNPPEGLFNLSEYTDGKRTSRNSGRGQFKSLSSLQGSKAIYIERNGGDNVMHLYFVPTIDALVGNDYVKSGKSKLEYNGKVFLKRNN